MRKRWRLRAGTAALTVFLLLSQVPLTAYGQEIGSADEERVSGEYIVASDWDLSGLSAGGPIAEVIFAGPNLALVRAEKGASLSDVKGVLDEEADSYEIQPNYVYSSSAVRDPFYSVQWGLYNTEGGADIDFDRAVSFIEKTRPDMGQTVVAVIDSGFDYTHEDLADNTWVNGDEIPGNKRDDDKNGYIDDIYGYDFTADGPLTDSPASREYEHGTHCAGTIGAVSGNGIGITGIASVTDSVSLMNLKVLAGRQGTGSTFDLIRAIRYAEENGADICNLSMGSYSDDDILYQTIKSSDMLFVCAAGNDGLNLSYVPIYPGCYNLDNVICVGNMRPAGNLNRLSNFSSRYVDIAAPGTNIYSTTPSSTYGSMSGTSMAAPFVSGTAALLHSYYSQISAADLKGLILNQADVRSALSGKVSGKKSLNVYRALSAYDPDAFEPDVTEPVIEASVSSVTGSYKQRLTVKATDDSGKKPVVRYVRGDKDKDFFRRGNGYKVTLNDENIGTKLMGVPSLYTVYAVDSAGNDSLYQVRCTADAVNSIKLNYTNRSLRKAYYFNLRATLSKSGTYGRKLTYTSSNKKIATVTSSGKVWGKKKGTVTITVKTDNLLTTKCRVTVK